MVFHWSLSDSKSPQVSRTLLNILVVLNDVVVWKFSTRPPTSKSSSPFSNPFITVPKTPITIVTCMFCNSFSSFFFFFFFYISFRWWYFIEVWVTTSLLESPGLFFSILADLHNVVVWMVSTCHLLSKFSSPFNNPPVTVPKAPIIIGIWVTITFHSFSLPKRGQGIYLSFYLL